MTREEFEAAWGTEAPPRMTPELVATTAENLRRFAEARAELEDRNALLAIKREHRRLSARLAAHHELIARLSVAALHQRPGVSPAVLALLAVALMVAGAAAVAIALALWLR